MTFITISRAVIEQALGALEYERNANNPLDWHHDKTINALRSALSKNSAHVSELLMNDGNYRRKALEQPAQKRPQNCGTGYCSCIECVMEQP